MGKGDDTARPVRRGGSKVGTVHTYASQRRAPPELREDVAAPLDGCVPRRVEGAAEGVELHVLCPLAQVLGTSCALSGSIK